MKLVAVALVLAAAMPLASGAQQRAARPIGAPIAEFEEPLTGPLRIIELRDGRVLVHDEKEKRLGIADFKSGEFTEASREGAGPKEFKSAMALVRAPGDSIWLYDLIQSRVLVIDPVGRPQRTTPFSDAGDMMAMLRRPMVRELDEAGNTYGELREMSIAAGRVTMSDSVVLIRSTKGKADTLAKMPSFLTAPEMGAGGIKIRLPGFPPMDAWGVFPDGRVLVVRGATYTPEIFLADGSRRKVTAIAFPAVRVTAADREKLMADTRKGVELAMSGARGMAGAGGGEMPKVEVVEPETWQPNKPPLTGTVIMVDEKNRAWVPVLSSNKLVRFDLLDADGRLIDAISFPEGAVMLGFGKGVVYATRKDEDDLLYLQRYRLP